VIALLISHKSIKQQHARKDKRSREQWREQENQRPSFELDRDQMRRSGLSMLIAHFVAMEGAHIIQK
jgi:hypothetical protein